MRSKAAVLAEDISTITEYIEFGKELATQLHRRWGMSSLFNSNDRTLNAKSVLNQLELLQVAFKQVEGDAVGEGFEEPTDG